MKPSMNMPPAITPLSLYKNRFFCGSGATDDCSDGPGAGVTGVFTMDFLVDRAKSNGDEGAGDISGGGWGGERAKAGSFSFRTPWSKIWHAPHSVSRCGT
jgi:hypothetical protein